MDLVQRKETECNTPSIKTFRVILMVLLLPLSTCSSIFLAVAWLKTDSNAKNFILFNNAQAYIEVIYYP
jgi:hypothetical protein